MWVKPNGQTATCTEDIDETMFRAFAKIEDAEIVDAGSLAAAFNDLPNRTPVALNPRNPLTPAALTHLFAS
eukprot:11489351-Prorocentrum_lima.AAC.1